MEVTGQVDQKHRHVHQLGPAAAAGLQDGFHVGEDAVDLGLEIEGLEVAVVVELQARHPAVVGVASRRPRTDAAQEQEVAHATGVGVKAHGFGRVGGGNAFAHDTKVGRPRRLPQYLRGMRYQKLPSDLYVQNREAFMKAMNYH